MKAEHVSVTHLSHSGYQTQINQSVATLKRPNIWNIWSFTQSLLQYLIQRVIRKWIIESLAGILCDKKRTGVRDNETCCKCSACSQINIKYNNIISIMFIFYRFISNYSPRSKPSMKNTYKLWNIFKCTCSIVNHTRKHTPNLLYDCCIGFHLIIFSIFYVFKYREVTSKGRTHQGKCLTTEIINQIDNVMF